MPQFNCPLCQKAFTAPAGSAAVKVLCPHCRREVEVPAAPRWYFARNKKKFGPYPWQQLVKLAANGELKPGDMLLQEGARQWVRADSLPDLFARATLAPKTAANHSLPWPVLAGISGTIALLIGIISLALYFYLRTPADVQQVKHDPTGNDKSESSKPPKKTDSDPPKKTVPSEEKKTKPPQKEKEKRKELPREQWTAQFIDRLNEHRKAAGVGSITLDVALSKACQTHALALAKGGDAPDGYAVVSLPPFAALDDWIGRLQSRVVLLNTEVQTVGLGFAQSGEGQWFCVLDPVRGRGEPMVIFPAPKQTDVPISFAGGPEVPDAKAAAGFPITVRFPRTKPVKNAQIELRDGEGKMIDAWIWTPEKPVPAGPKQNALILIAKGFLKSGAEYQVKASAQVDGQSWSLSWSFTTEDDSDSKGVWAKKALDRINSYRAQAGLKPVVLDDRLSKGCLAHARYLVINEGRPELEGLNAHKEDPKLPGYSKEGHEAGIASDIAIGDYEPIDGVDSWMATLYHRVPILEPHLKTIGFGCARGRRLGWVTVVNVQAGREAPRDRPIFYPMPDQTGVPLNFPNGGEEPNPIPEDKGGRAGFPITASFPLKQPLKDATAKLTDAKGEEVPCWFSSPEKPANPKFAAAQGATVCLIAKAPLTPNTTFQVQLQGTLAGKPYLKQWKFTTADAGLSSQNAARAVVERLNEYRVQAGLSPVVLDDKFSRGCRLHAEYLAKNADVLQKIKAPVNVEDAALPWYTLEGAQAAQHSLVFTNAPTPILQIDDLMATAIGRVYLFEPSLQRLGFGCANDVGRGWRCVLDTQRGRGGERIIVYPGRNQEGVPTTAQDAPPGVKGFPISVNFPQRSKIADVRAVLKDAEAKDIDFKLVTPDQPLGDALPRNIVGIYPVQPLRPGHTYSVTVSAIVGSAEWRETWQFTTAKN